MKKPILEEQNELETRAMPINSDDGWAVIITVNGFTDEPDARAWAKEFNQCGDISFVDVTFTLDGSCGN